MEYLEAVHKNDVEFLAPIRDLEVEDKWAVFGGRQLFDEWSQKICSVGL